MADPNPTQPPSGDTSDPEHPSDTEHNRGYDESTRAREGADDEQSEDIDPDSAESDIDRDDTIDEI